MTSEDTPENNPEDLSFEDKQMQEERKSQHALRGLISAIRYFFKDRLSILDNANPESTIEGIERDISFKGFNLWILIPAILIASVGLNANSTAVIVGAMLISPLMGPIMGIGLSIGIYDFQLLKRSMRNLAIAVVVSIITSTVFFFIIPLDDASSELLARTQPDIRDVFIGFLGGLAGILAGSRKEKGNVIPGVAIATALMPPLCTAGYGLATLQFQYFLGAAYLFLINAFFIALATVLVVRYLRFPVKSFLESRTERRAKFFLWLTVLVMIIPASIIFVNVVQDTLYLKKVNQFIDKNIQYQDCEVVKRDIKITDSISYINIVMFGERIPEKTIQSWQSILDGIVDNTKLRIFQGSDQESLPEVQKLVDMYTDTQEKIADREEAIKNLENEIERYKQEALPFSLLKEIRINYPEVHSIKMGRMVYADFEKEDAHAQPNFFVWWKGELPDSTQIKRQRQLQRWLETRLLEDSITVTTVK